jgi:hypothetical protein
VSELRPGPARLPDLGARERRKATVQFEEGCRRVARLFLRPKDATAEDGAFVLEMLTKAFVEPPSAVSYTIDDTGALCVEVVHPDEVVRWREGQKSVVTYLIHAIDVGRGAIDQEKARRRA